MFVLAWEWLKRFTMDPKFAAARLRAVLIAIAGSGAVFSDDLASAIGDPSWTRRIKIAAIVLGVIAAAKRAGEKNDDAETIAEKLRGEGYLVTKMEPVPADPPATPPPAAGFIDWRWSAAVGLGVLFVGGFIWRPLHWVLGVVVALVLLAALLLFAIITLGRGWGWWNESGN